MKSLISLVALAAVAGCTATSASGPAPARMTGVAVRQASNTAEAECARFGYTPGTRPFQECTADMRQQARTLATAQP